MDEATGEAPKHNGARKLRKRDARQGTGRAARKRVLLTREALPPEASKMFDGIVNRIASDLGGHDALSEMERHLVVSFAGEALVAHGSIGQMLRNDPAFQPCDLASATSGLVRIARRLGTRRRQRDVGPSLVDILRAEDPGDDGDYGK